MGTGSAREDGRSKPCPPPQTPPGVGAERTRVVRGGEWGIAGQVGVDGFKAAALPPDSGQEVLLVLDMCLEFRARRWLR